MSETSSEKRDMQEDSERAKENKMSSKSEKRISVTFSDCFNIPDAPGSKSSLSKKYIFSHIYHPRRDLHYTILSKGARRSWEEKGENRRPILDPKAESQNINQFYICNKVLP